MSRKVTKETSSNRRASVTLSTDERDVIAVKIPDEEMNYVPQQIPASCRTYGSAAR
ncbi:MAG: hypothetical protein NVS2B12_07520 [Ktedonobacteraceae bacterium]